MVFIRNVSPAENDVRTGDRPLIEGERAVADLDVDRDRARWRGDRLLPFPGQPPVPNALTTQLELLGRPFSVYNFQGNIDQINDLVGYNRGPGA